MITKGRYILGENEVLNLGKNFDNKSVYFSKNTPKFPHDIDKKGLKTTKPFVGSSFAAITDSNFPKESYHLMAS